MCNLPVAVDPHLGLVAYMSIDSLTDGVISNIVSVVILAAVGWLFRWRLADWFARWQERMVQRTGGLLGVEDSWYDLVNFVGRYGHRLRKHCEQANNATWYFITHDPAGFDRWLGRVSEGQSIAQAVKERNINVVWVYHAEDHAKTVRPLFMINATDDRLAHYSVGRQKLLLSRQGDPGNWKIYKSTQQHFYMAFLSVPNLGDSYQDHAPPGTFGFVHPYLMVPRGYTERCALYLEAGDTRKRRRVLDLYYRSILDFLEIGKREGWLVADTEVPIS